MHVVKNSLEMSLELRHFLFYSLVGFLVTCIGRTTAEGLFDASHSRAQPDSFNGSAACKQLLQRRGYATAMESLQQNLLFPLPSMALIGDYTMRSSLDWLQLLQRRLAQKSNIMYIAHERNASSCEGFKLLLQRHSAELRDAQVVMWNFGLEAMHLRPVRTRDITTIDSYAAALLCMAGALRVALPAARLLYRLTNPVCVDKVEAALRTAADEWMNSPHLVFAEDYELQMTRTGADLINHFEKELQHVPQLRMKVLNHEAAGSCECTHDGLQYLPLLPEFWSKFLQQHQQHQQIQEQQQLQQPL